MFGGLVWFIPAVRSCAAELLAGPSMYRMDPPAAAVRQTASPAVMVQHNPANISGHGGAGHLRKPGSARRLEHNGIRTRPGRTLDVVQQLLALRNRVIVGVDDLQLYT